MSTETLAKLRLGRAPSLLRERAQGVFLVWLLAAGLGCSHERPYYRDVVRVDAPDSAQIRQRLLLIGDAGDPDPEGEGVLVALAGRVREMPERTTVVFLGDNVYETGMPDATELEGTVVEEILDEMLLNLYESRRDAERRLNAQLAVVHDSEARAVFIPGNHDWDQFGIGGWERVLTQEIYLERVRAETGADVALLPGGGCPGPVRVELGAVAEVVVLDTQWWLDESEKPSPEHNPSGCSATTEAAVIEQLEAALFSAHAEGRTAVVAAHHPLRTHGPHGGFFDVWTHLFPLKMLSSYVPIFVRWLPLPGLGSLMVGFRACCSPSNQDLSAADNERLRRRLHEAMASAAANGAAPLLYAAGHEHSLQLFRGSGGARYTLVSGLGSSSKASAVGHGDRTLFAHAHPDRPGFVQVDFLAGGRVRLAVIEAHPDIPEGIEVHSRLLESPGRPVAVTRSEDVDLPVVDGGE